ncbi:MAG: flavin reductase [Oscillospiraceae bacterium]|nr:flavin reductase [Oscillospiraceae bacterium]
MHCVRNVTKDLVWVGADDRRLAMFEGVYGVRDGVSYNSYLLLDEKTVLFDTVDRAVCDNYFENVEAVLNGRKLDYLIVQHMEPDHAACIQDLILRYPEVKVICSAMTKTMLGQFFTFDTNGRVLTMQEGDTLETGRHTFTFVMAPMVHWPEVMLTYDLTDKILFSADAFGTFGALNGHLFSDEVDFMRDYLDEARRYYTNIVGKYGDQVQAVLKKAAGLEINLVCPLHGFVWRKHFGDILEKYLRWSSYTPEEEGVVIAYASVYGNTENAANLLACRLAEQGVKVKMFDVSVIPSSYILSDAFKYSHLVFCSTTYNAGIFISMEELLHDIANHGLRNRKVAFLENGSWAPTSGQLMADIILPLKGMQRIGETITVVSSVKPDKMAEIEKLASKIARDILPEVKPVDDTVAVVENNAFFDLSYGLFVVTARDGDRDAGCIINTAAQLTDNPKRMTITVNKANHTHDVILKNGVFNISVLTEDAPFSVFQRFGFRSGRDTDKFEGWGEESRSVNGVRYLAAYTNAFFSCRVIEARDCGTHTLFIADVTEARVLDTTPSVTYAYYFAHIKPKPAAIAEKTGYVCKICGFVYEGEELPEDYICPLCKHGAADFEKL